MVDIVETPVAENDKAETPPDTHVTVDVTENDSSPDPDKPFEVTDVTEPENGTCDVVDNQIQYTTESGFLGTDECTYTVCVEGTEICDEAYLVVDVVKNPDAEDNKVETPLDTPVTVDVSKNDSNPTPDKPLEVTEITNQSENGSCEVIDNEVLYAPEAGFVGIDECTYTVCVKGTYICNSVDLIIDVIYPPVEKMMRLIHQLKLQSL